MYSRRFIEPKIHYVSTAGKPLATFRGVPEKASKVYDSIMAKKNDKVATPPRWALIARPMMEERGITQEDLVETFQVKTRGAIGHYFRGIREPSIDQIARFAKRLGITVSQLIGEIPLTNDPASTDEISLLLREIRPDDLPLLLNMLRAAASSKRPEEN